MRVVLMAGIVAPLWDLTWSMGPLDSIVDWLWRQVLVRAGFRRDSARSGKTLDSGISSKHAAIHSDSVPARDSVFLLTMPCIY